MLREIEYTVHNFIFDTKMDDKIILYENFHKVVNVAVHKINEPSITETRHLNMSTAREFCFRNHSKSKDKTTLTLSERARRTLFYKLSSLSDVSASRQDHIIFHNDIHTLGNSWVAIRVHFYTCQMQSTMFLPNYLQKFMWKTVCVHSIEPSLDATIQHRLTSDGYELKYPAAHKGTTSILRNMGGKIAIYDGFQTIFRTEEGAGGTVYIEGTPSEPGHLHIHYSIFASHWNALFLAVCRHLLQVRFCIF